MTARAMPLAWVRVMILLTSASIAAPLGIVCATAATGRQKAGKNKVKSGRTPFLVLIVIIRSSLHPTDDLSDEGVPSGPDYSFSLEDFRDQLRQMRKLQQPSPRAEEPHTVPALVSYA